MFFALSVIILLILFPSQAAAGAAKGLQLCATAVIPSLFPFFVLTRILVSRLPNFSCKCTQKYLGISPNVLPAFLVSFLGGYPVGVATVVALYEEGRMKKHEAEHALLFCNNSGPAFFVGMIGSVLLGSVKKGLILYLIQIFSALICAVFLRKEPVKASIVRIKKVKISFAQSFTDAVANASAAILQVAALVIFSSTLIALVQRLGLLESLPQTYQAFLFGSMELTSGLTMFKNSEFAFIGAAFLMGWGGLCVHMQATALWQKAGLHPVGYYPAKLLHALLCASFASCYQAGRIPFGLCVLSFFIISVIFIVFRQIWGSKKDKLVV